MRKTLIQLVSTLAIANLLALIGAVGFLFGTGRLDADRVERITEIIVGEDEEETDDVASEIEQPDEKEQAHVKLARAREESDLTRPCGDADPSERESHCEPSPGKSGTWER